jgi:hypothetical protein
MNDRRIIGRQRLVHRLLTDRDTREIARKACALQGMPPDHYDEKLTEDKRHAYERGVEHVIRAMLDLGWTVAPNG